MNDIHKKPNFYFIAAPIIAAIWLAICGGIFLRNAEARWEKESANDIKAQEKIERILKLDPERLKKKDQDGKAKEFDYTNVIDSFTRQFDIKPSNHDLRVRPESKRGGKRTRSANLIIKSIDAVRLSKFLSALQKQWPELQLNTLKMTNTNAGPDDWKVDIQFTYIY